MQMELTRMKKPFRKMLVTAFATLALSSAMMAPADAYAKDHFKVAWSIYVGWMPWKYAQDHGIIKKWADKYGIDIDVVQINDYIESINQYTAGGFDACTMTNMDALTIPAAGGVDSTALIIGDFSNGNDAIVLKGKDKLADIKGQNVNLVELSVSHYLLARALETVNMVERDVNVVNTSDADIVAAYSSPDVTSVVTWNPQLSEINKMPGAHEVFNSSQIPGEIIDMMVMNTQTLKENPKFAKAMVGAWYETMALMSGNDEKAKAAKATMGKDSGTDLAGYESQLKSTMMFYTPKSSYDFTVSKELPKTMALVSKFSFEHGLLGDNAKSADAVGIAFPSGEIMGDKSNVKLRFDATYVGMAAEGKL